MKETFLFFWHWFFYLRVLVLSTNWSHFISIVLILTYKIILTWQYYIYIYSLYILYVYIYIYVYLNFSYLIYLLILTSKIILTWHSIKLHCHDMSLKIDIDQINDKGNIQQANHSFSQSQVCIHTNASINAQLSLGCQALTVGSHWVKNLLHWARISSKSCTMCVGWKYHHN